jgi:hypothetical protein
MSTGQLRKSVAWLTLVTVLAWPRSAQPIDIVSTPATNSASAAGGSFLPAFSQDGWALSFVSHANNLVTNDDSALALDVFLMDLVSGRPELLSVNTTGVGGGNFDSTHALIGRYGLNVVFASRSSNLTTNDTNNAVDIFHRYCGGVTVGGHAARDRRPVRSQSAGSRCFSGPPFVPQPANGCVGIPNCV